jgi:MFS family permease
LEPILPLYLGELLGAGPTQTGLIFLAAIFPTLFSSAIGYYADKVGHFYVSLLGMAIFAFATFSLSMPKSFLAFILPLALFGLGSSTILTPLLPAMADVVNKKGWNGYAKTYALYNMTYSLSMAVGPILAGFIFEDFGFWWMMVMFGIMIVVATPVIFTAQIAQVIARWRGSSRTSDTVHA